MLPKKQLYNEKVVPALKKELGIENPMAVPRVGKIVVNIGTGKILKDAKRVEDAIISLGVITGQKVVATRARKAIAGFKTREGLEVGARVTLHGKRMWDFLDRLVNVALPRVRDFQGIPRSAIDQSGNCNIGIKEHLVFPEIVAEKVQNIFSFQINIVTTAKNRQEGEVLFRLLGLPLEQVEVTREK
ncbi:MAG: 50S ribosomal protein L5 [Candidatus Moranbacteria bacterium CG_4_10_14_3_um_filter_45_9]|nr:MAG: 50S ribosomal protein L5 [Candidatus Moranbacteria bacterium CG_4_10_14_3_um_filter_45_9]PJA85945.1 MAG: 50S ribosomal protein L5 [Candidatus Moranbacteria bacterium CG_4_9_14_3_um_filter_45_14]